MNFGKYMLIIVPTAILFGVIILWSSVSVTISAGHRGVLFEKFGKGIVKNYVYSEGFHFVAPWNSMIDYEVRQQSIEEKMSILSSNGLEITVDVSMLYQPKEERLGYLHANIGGDYKNRVVIPAIRSAARSVIGRYTPEEIYSTKRDAIQHEIYEETKKILDKKDIVLDQVLVRSIILPATIKTAIESKLQQEQEELAYEFRLKKAEKEAERQRIEADGKAAANKIIAASLTENILKEKGIEATQALASSTNAKVVIVGGKDGLPVILGDK